MNSPRRPRALRAFRTSWDHSLESRRLLSVDVTRFDPEIPGHTGNVLVLFDPTLTDQQASDRLGTAQLRELQRFDSGWRLIAPAEGSTAEAALDALRGAPGVLQVDFEHTFRIADTIPNDTFFPQQWGLNNALTGDSDIDGPQAWDISQGRSIATIAITDTGIDYRHPDLYLGIALNQGEIPASKSGIVDTNGDGAIDFYDLNSLNAAGNVVRNGQGNPVNAGYTTDLPGAGAGYIDAGDLLADPTWADGVDGDGNGLIDDLVGWNFENNTNNPFDGHGHGTHVSGISAARTNNGGVGVAGVNWHARILPLKMIADNGSGPESAAIAAIDYAAARNVRVINASWGDVEASDALRVSIENAGTRALGTVFVAAAGNNNWNIDSQPFYPAAFSTSTLLSIAAVDINGNRASFSNYGLNSVDLAAPGVTILSTYPNSNYANASGTSMAAPHVTGVVSLLVGQNPAMTAGQLISRVLTTAKPMTGLTGLVATGGMVSASRALSGLPLAEIDVQDGSTSVVSGGGSVAFGSTTVGTPTTKTLTVRNLGTAPLVLGAPTMPAGFSLASSFATNPLAPGGSTTFTLQFNAAAVGVHGGTVAFATNDPDEDPYRFQLTATAVPAAVSYSDTVLQDAPAAYWRLGEAPGASTASDHSGQGRAGTYLNGVALGQAGALAGDSDASALFDGVNDLVNVPDNPALRPALLSLEAWLNPAANLPAYASPLMKTSSVQWGDGYGFYVLNNQITFFVNHWNATKVQAALPSGAWTHVAATFDGTALRLYLNGQLAATTTLGAPTSIHHTLAPLVIGQGAGGYTWSGRVDEPAVYGSVLSPERIDAHYQAGRGNTQDTTPPTADIVDVTPDPRTIPVPSISIVFSEPVTNFDLADLSLTRDGGANLLTAGQTLSTTNNITWTLGNLAGLTPSLGTYSLVLDMAGVLDLAGNAGQGTVTDSWVMQAASQTNYAPTILADSPAAYWRLGEAPGDATALDASGHQHHGAYQNGVALGQTGALAGGTDTAAGFDTLDDLVAVPDHAELRPARLTLEAWVRPGANVQAYDGVLMKTSSVQWNDGYGLYWLAGNLVFYVNHYNNTKVQAPVPSQSWTHVVATFDGAALRLYINGTLAGSLNSAIPINHTLAPLTIGQGAGGYTWGGQLDEVALYTEALSADRVDAHYRAGVGGTGQRFQAARSSIADQPASSNHDSWELAVGLLEQAVERSRSVLKGLSQ